MRTLWRITIVGVVMGFLLSIGLFIRHINGPRVVGRAVAPDGTEMCIVQRCNWCGEPFTTSFYIRKPGRGWGWFYFDHEDWYWGKSRVYLDTNNTIATFYRGKSAAIRFDWSTETYWRGQNAWATGAQSYMVPGQNPF
jgi:hypothetical protein